MTEDLAARRPAAGSAPAPVPPPVDESGGILLTDLVKTYRTPGGSLRAVDGVSLSIAAGETIALLGPNGAGKSTTIDMMTGLQDPDSGTVRLFGRTPRQAVDSGRVAAMLQTGTLIRDLSVRELVTMMASIYPRPMAVDDVIELVGITDIAGRRTQKLSGGQTQRVRAALALVANPDLLILDEPTVAMDVEVRHSFWATMRQVTTSGKTVLFATHYLEEADAYADRIVLMARGRIVADGAATEIKSLVGGRTLRATLPDAPVGELAALPGVSSADRHGEAIVLACADSDATVRALLARWPAVRDLEITGAGLEQAFLQLTGDQS